MNIIVSTPSSSGPKSLQEMLRRELPAASLVPELVSIAAGAAVSSDGDGFVLSLERGEIRALATVGGTPHTGAKGEAGRVDALLAELGLEAFSDAFETTTMNAVANGDKAALDQVTEACYALARTCALLCHIHDPHWITITGEVANLPAALQGALRQIVVTAIRASGSDAVVDVRDASELWMTAMAEEARRTQPGSSA